VVWILRGQRKDLSIIYSNMLALGILSKEIFEFLEKVKVLKWRGGEGVLTYIALWKIGGGGRDVLTSQAPPKKERKRG